MLKQKYLSFSDDGNHTAVLTCDEVVRKLTQTGIGIKSLLIYHVDNICSALKPQRTISEKITWE